MKKMFLIVIVYAFSLLEVYSSQTFERALLNYGMSKEDVNSLPLPIALGVVDHRELLVLKHKLLQSDDIQETVVLYIDDSDKILTLTKNQFGYNLEESSETYTKEMMTYQGAIVGTIFDSVLRDTDDEILANTLQEAFQLDFKNTKKLKSKAQYSFDVETILVNSEIVDHGIIENAKINVGEAIIEKEAIYDLDSETSRLHTKEPTAEEKVFLSPVESHRVSSLFNLQRKHPVTRKVQPHRGIDFVAKSGTPVFPALEGTIIAIGRARAKGKFILIEHASGFKSTYDHLRKFTKHLKVGDFVTTNDQIGEVGKTGYATGAHLHFGLIKNGEFVDPLPYFQQAEAQSSNEKE
ncbi:MAG: M23 family metallopeptidase [Bacteriovoracaceae bacterium]|nr:M23 family metallopeptidase [Bacteriovoracaceae bacterium]